MTLNIFYGGDELDLTTGDFCEKTRGCPRTLTKMIAAIRASKADVVGLEEGEHSTQRIADALGWFASERMQIVSRYRLIDPPEGRGRYIFVELDPAGSWPSGTSICRPTRTARTSCATVARPQELQELELSVRMPAIQEHLSVLPGLAAKGIPGFLTGDFNSPSHLDWTPAVAAVRDEVPFAFDWPVSRALADAGFRDSYRQSAPRPGRQAWVHLDLGRPRGRRERGARPHRLGLGRRPGPRGQEPDPRREGRARRGHRRRPVSDRPPRGRLHLPVKPGRPPVFVAVESRRLTIGKRLSVVFHAPGRKGEHVAIVPAGGAGADAVASRSTGAHSRRTERCASRQGTTTRRLRGRTPRQARRGSLPQPVLALPRQESRPRSSPPGASIGRSADPGLVVERAGDALGLARDLPLRGRRSGPEASTCNATLCGNGDYLLYEYTRASIEGDTSFTADSFTGSGAWPLEPGRYEVRLLLDDGYRSVATSRPFRVVKR